MGSLSWREPPVKPKQRVAERLLKIAEVPERWRWCITVLRENRGVLER